MAKIKSSAAHSVTLLSPYLAIMVGLLLVWLAACYSAALGLCVAVSVALLLGAHARHVQVAAQQAQQESVARENHELVLQLLHDLKNSLSAAVGTAHLLMDLRQTNLEDPLACEDVEYLEIICASTTHMSAIIDDVETMEHLDRTDSQLTRKLCEVPEILELVLAEQRTNAERKGITLELLLSEPFMAEVYPDYLPILFENLLSNAIKFSALGHKVQVDLGPTAGGASWEFSVRDEGVGLSPQEQTELFQKFKTLSPLPTGDECSTGLGLYLVRRIAEIHGGQVGVESECQRGSRFWVRLPFGPTCA
jgi:signal transduction histidine kinase